MGKATKVISFLLFFSLLLTLLPACKPEPAEHTEPPAEAAFSALDLAAALSSAAVDQLGNSPQQLDSTDSKQLTAYVEAAYGLSAGQWEDCAVIRALGAQAYEISVLRFASVEEAAHGTECLEVYLTAREGDFTGYAPDQAVLVSNAVVCREGLYVGLFICTEPAAAEALFHSILETGELPEVIPSTEPEVDMLLLMVRLLACCKDEIDALGGWGRITNLEYGPQEENDYFFEISATDYGADKEQIESGFHLLTSTPAAPDHAFDLTVLCMKTEEAAVRGVDGFQSFLKCWEDVFIQADLPEEAELTANGLIVQQGRYLALFVCQNPEAVRNEFNAALQEPTPTNPLEPTDTLQAVDIALLRERLWDFCQDEIDRTPDVEYRLGIRSALWGMDVKQVKDSFQIISFNKENSKQYAFELIVLYLADEAAAAQAALHLQIYAWDRMTIYNSLGFPDQAELAANGLVVRYGRYAAMFICEDPKAVNIEFQSAIRELQPIAASQSPENTDGPVFEEVDSAEPQGEADPDHPGRIRFVQPNELDMSLYNTSGILAAWETGDSSGLSEQDQVIYSRAKAVLDSVLRNGMSDYEKEIAVYDWMLRNISYDWSHADVLTETERASYTPYGGLVDGSASCLGISTTFQLLMDMAGVECVTVTGAAHSSKDDHAWNMVRLGDVWYCVDATWDVNHWEGGGRTWRYFNVTSDYMARTNHQWDYDGIPEAVTGDHGQSVAG